jgi:hypothetical protein
MGKIKRRMKTTTNRRKALRWLSLSPPDEIGILGERVGVRGLRN